MTPVVHRDAGALVAAHLRITLPTLGVTGPVVSVVPDPRPDNLVLVRRVGGVAANVVTDAATLTIECWAVDEGSAMDRAQIARAVLHDLVGRSLDGSPVYRVIESAGPAAMPDPLSNQPRVTMTIEVWMRGRDL